MRHLLCGTVLGGLIVVQGGLASAQQIVPNGLGTQVTVNGQQFDITGGTRAGANLFHSFAKFGLSQAQIAHFLSNPAIRNILARVTGGEVSVINGLIKVTGGNSNLYLMNPAGIVFGQGASLNVPAAFHATTANAIKIGNGYFGMNTTAAELALFTAEPNGYAFSSLNQNLNPGTPAGVILNQADLSVNPGQTMVLAGNQVINTGTIQSPNGTVVITATADGKFVNVSQSGSILSLDLPVAVNQDIALQNLRPVLPSDIPQLLTGTAYVSGTVSTASTVKNPDSLINITGERVILDKANLDNLGTDGLIQIRVAPGITSEGYVFLDRVRNYEQLVNALAPGSTAYLINKTDSGVEKVNQVVANNGAVQRIDIVGDGNTGQIWFGRDFITVDTLPSYESQIAQWSQGLTGSREIYLYACNLAASIAGKELVGEIGNLTNSTVLASTDITGSGQYRGNWQFEYSTGNIAGQIAFDAQAVQSADVKLQTFTVLNNSDTGSGSLRQAISDANAASGADSIAFAPATNGTPIVLTTGELTVTDSAGLTITGNGATNTIIDGNNTSRVFNITAGDITFNGVTIRNGNTPGNGGGILANGSVTLNNSTVAGNTAGSQGGGIFIRGNLTLNNSTVSGNKTINSFGGGIRADFGAGIITLNNSTVSGNRAGSDAGGIDSSGAGVILNNSTVSGNTGTRGGGIWSSGFVILNNSTVSGNTGTDGGGIWSSSTTTIRNSTIAFNTGNRGGGIFNDGGTVNIGNSIVAKNTAGTSPDIGGSSYINAGNNLIGINTGFEATFPASSLVGTASSPVDPLLAPLANNGGLTETHALLPGSPAINAGSNALIPSGVTTDQRGAGFARIVGGTVDIGAFELQRVVASRESVVNEILFGQEFVTPNFDFGLDAIEDVALTDFVARFDIAEALGTGDFEAILALDTLFTGEFDRFLGVSPINNLNSVEAIGNMLSRLAQETGKKPAIVYLMVDERQLTVAAIPPGSRAGVARAGLVASTTPLAQREAQVQPVVRGIPEAKRANLMPVVERFLTALKDPRQRTSTAYLKDAQQLYRWFIAPIEKELQAQGIDTLLFSMDNGLRLLPVAALHDGQQFLVEKYSTALIPSVNLIDTRYRNLRDARVLAMGADTFANQAPLPAVPVELKVITEEWPGQSFLNQEFTVQRLTQERLQGGYPIIHLATHADFAPGRLTNSYIEFGNNQRLNLPQVRELPLREPNVVELLTLSACRTSVGDVSAELGFAGLAVQAGVKSALASLWYVSDEGTLALMTEFYKNLRQAPIKAEALRQAQIAMLRGKVTIKGGELRGVRGGIPVPSAIAQRGDQVLNHPYYWAAFTLIGSPW